MPGIVLKLCFGQKKDRRTDGRTSQSLYATLWGHKNHQGPIDSKWNMKVLYLIASRLLVETVEPIFKSITVTMSQLGMRRYGDISIQDRYGGSWYVSWPSAIYCDTTLTFVIRGSHHVVSIFSSPEHEVLMVSYCGQWLSVVRRRVSSVVRQHLMFTLYRPHLWSDLDETLSECLFWQYLGQVRIWVMSGQKLGHQVKS